MVRVTKSRLQKLCFGLVYLFSVQGVFSQSLPDVGMRPFFVVPNPGEKLSETSGVILNYGYGRRAGTLTLESRGGKVKFFLPRYGSMIVLGQRIKCGLAPFGDFKGFMCDDWPRSIVLRSSTVYVRYFVRTLSGEGVKVADEIRLAP